MRGRGRVVGIDVDQPLRVQPEGAQIVDAVDMVGMGMRVDHAVDAIDVGREQLRAQVGAGVDQDASSARSPSPKRSISSAQRERRFLGLVRIAGAPVIADARHAAASAAAEDGRARTALTHGRVDLAEKSKEIVRGRRRPALRGDMPLTSARTFAVSTT